MQAMRLGRSGLMVSPLALGTAAFGDPEKAGWNVGAEQATRLVRHAWDRGITLFDCGASYGGGLAEERLGDALHALGHRDEIVVTTKYYFPTGDSPNQRGLSRKYLTAALDRSLRRLRTDHIDLAMIHRWDAGTPIEETLATLDGFVRSGKILYLGASSMSAWRLMKALGLQRSSGLAPFVAMQGHHNLLYREEEREMIPLTREEGLAYLAWSPLARGRLAGPAADAGRLQRDSHAIERFAADLDQPVLDALDAVAGDSGIAHAEFAIAWLSGQGIIPVIGASSPAEIDTAVAAVDRRIDARTRQRLEVAYRPHRIIGFDPREEAGD